MSRESQSPGMPKRSVPPLVVEGVRTLPTAAFWTAAVEPPELLAVLVVLPPEHAVMPRARTAPEATAIIRFCFIWVSLLGCCEVESSAEPVGTGYGYRDRGSKASRRPSPKRLKARTVTKMARPAGRMNSGSTWYHWVASESIPPHVARGGRTPTPR